MWKAVYTKPRHEMKVARRLEGMGINVYAPTQVVLRQWSDRKKRVRVPVFNSYVFLNCETLEELSVLQTSGVVNFVKRLGQVAQIRDSEIQQIKDFLSGYESVKVEENNTLSLGDKVIVTDGAVKGRRGAVTGFQRHKARLVLEDLGLEIIAEVPVASLIKDHDREADSNNPNRRKSFHF